MGIYSGPSYAMGAVDVAAAANAPITKSQAVAAKRELARMRRALSRWLRFRSINDQVAAGNADKVPSALLKTWGATPAPAAVVAMNLARNRAEQEAPMAAHLHQLLSEVFDASALPDPDLTKNPNAAVQLAQIAVAGKLPGEKPTATGSITGAFWFWPAVVVVGGIALVLTTLIRSNAEVAEQKEETECIKSGKCTDYGFWLKIAGVAVAGYIVWEKVGVGAHVKALTKKRGRR